ncbi:MAG TPA: diacylglycerol kinase family protein, partial [Tepidisphaeraceae bacterium]
SEGVMGVLPMGTLNHFAKDLKLPLELAEAARVIAQGAPRKVDVATVNGRVFLNNSSIGIYPHIVKRRDRMMERLGRGKWLSMLVAVLSLFRRFPLVRVRLGIGDKTVLRTTPFVFVGNNEYELDALALGGRKTIEGGVLCLYFANRTGRWGLFVLALRALLGRLNESKDFESLCLKEVWIESSKKRLRVSADGELMRMSPPLHYQIRPAALKVMAPRDATNDAAPG